MTAVQQQTLPEADKISALSNKLTESETLWQPSITQENQ